MARSARGEEGMAVSAEVFEDLVLDLRTGLVAAAAFLTLLERAEGGPSARRYVAGLRESVESLREVIDRARTSRSRSPVAAGQASLAPS